MCVERPLGSVRALLFSGAALVLLAALVWVAQSSLLGSGCPSSKTRTDMHAIQQAIKLYRLERGAPPRSWRDLLGPPPTKGGATARPYLEEIPRDPWGRPYLCYRHGQAFEVLSLGAEGKPGGEGEDRDQRWSELFADR